jgi:hypothetical protein
MSVRQWEEAQKVLREAAVSMKKFDVSVLKIPPNCKFFLTEGSLRLWRAISLDDLQKYANECEIAACVAMQYWRMKRYTISVNPDATLAQQCEAEEQIKLWSEFGGFVDGWRLP